MYRNNLALAGCCLALVAAGSLSGCAADRAAAPKSRVAAPESRVPVVINSSASVIKMSPTEMKARARAVVMARVVRRVGAFAVQEPSGDDRTPGSTMTRVFTDWEVMPLKVYKTDGRVSQGSPIRVALFGGEVDGVRIVNTDEADLTAGETVVLFLTQEMPPQMVEDGRYFILTLRQGKYHVNYSTGRAENGGNTISLKELESILLDE